jgi:predicted permease
MGIPLLRGRDFTGADRADSPAVVLINERFARDLWPNENPIGRRVGLGDHKPATIVGVVGDVRHTALEVPAGNQIYVPAAQWADASAVLVVRGSGDPGALGRSIRAAIASIDSDQPVSRIATLGRVVSDAAGSRRFAMELLIGFAGLAALLAGIGIYGVVSGFVGRRTREIGVRMALGASRRSILSLVALGTVRRTVIGLGVGLIGAVTLGRALKGLLFEVAPADPRALAAGCVGVLAVALAASLWPARRATRVDPIVALREE